MSRPEKPQRVTRSDAFQLQVPFAERVRADLLREYRRERFDPLPHQLRWVVRIWTDGGLVGVGEAVADPREAIASLPGRSVAELLHDGSLGPAVLIAVYDLEAQARGVPIARLFSESPRARVRQAWWSRCFAPDLLRTEARLAVALGYGVHKIKSRPWRDPVEQVAAILDAVPDDYEIVIDANGTFGSAEKTLRLARALQHHAQVSAFEEPIPHHDIVGYGRLRGALPFRLAVHWEAVDARAFIARSLYGAFVVEDFLWGPPLVQKAEACTRGGQTLWLENGLHSGISQVFQAHMAAALPAVELSISLTHVLEDDLVCEPFTVERGGLYEVPTTPGLGVTLDEDAVERYRA